MHLKEKCAEVKNKQECIKDWDFVTYDDHGNIHEVRCKFCSTPIVGWRQIGQPEMHRVPDDAHTILVVQKMALLRFGSYRELLIHFDDTSAHATPVCNACVNREFTLEELETCHLCDMEDLHNCCSNEMQREAHEKLAVRKPVWHEEHKFMENIIKRIE